MINFDSTTWSVNVTVNGQNVLFIDNDSYGGKELTAVEAEAVRLAAENLLAFVGPREKEPFDFEEQS